MWSAVLAFAVAIFTPTAIMAQQSDQNLVPSSSECGVLREDQFYNLEKSVADNEFPWMANLLNGDSEFLCLSVLIGKQYVVAAARCLEIGHLYGDFIVELGNCKKKSQCSVKIEVQTFVQHPKHKLHKLAFDIAVLRLKQPVTITDYIRPICLPSAEVAGQNFAAQHMTMTGKQFLGGQSAKYVVLIVGTSRCQKIYDGLLVDESILCANTCDNGSKYFSGSALMGVSLNNTTPNRYYLVGLLTSGVHGCLDSTPDIFQRIDRHMNWITETVIGFERTTQ